MEFPYFTYDTTYQCFPHTPQEYPGQPFIEEFDTTGQDILLSFPDSTDSGSAAAQSSIAHGYHRLVSPEETPTVIKDEILIPERVVPIENPTGAYPSPSVGASEDDLEEIDVAPSQSEDDEDDDEYHPDKKRHASAAPRANKLKRGAAKKPLEKPTAKRSHVKKQHTRPFICVFGFAGCDSTFASKNEWKRHVMSQHLLLYYWLCDIDVCAHNKNDPAVPHSHSGKRSKSRRADNGAGVEPIGPPLPDGAIFNRKDLYTQHLRRMHTPAHIKKTGSAKSSRKTTSSPQASSCASSAEWDDAIKTFQCNALRERCQLPDYMQCPALHCSQIFNGADAWDQRMEHVARHLEKAATGAEDPVVFGGPTDPSLMAWVSRPDVAVARQVAGTGEWVLNNPLRPAGEGRAAGRKRSAPSAASPPVVVAASPVVTSVASEILVENEDEDEDAEGEEE
ncbi:putative c2h2 finger domain-containing protein [Diaporthe ampelina]|uniref:Putative c2h2 finger domain-containing protein n=1 Tax=Diaporthe ampelina TaxID=1214573 RepID=A0A0G2I2R7_9PEZI|nr:putative c2h2 finger domain-containing protein [Diaporthe ampelina]